ASFGAAGARICRSPSRQPASRGEGGMTTSDLTAGKGARSAYGVEPVAAVPELAAGHQLEDSSGGQPSRTTVFAASVAFGIVFLLVWQFLPPALGVPSYIIPTVTDLVNEFGRMVTRDNLWKHVLSTTFIATTGFVIGSLLGAALGYL